jgi:hypothetical protein
MEEYEDASFDCLAEVKGAILGVLDNELEVFDPICDGEVTASEGMAYLERDLRRYFRKNKEDLEECFQKNKEESIEILEDNVTTYLEGRVQYLTGDGAKIGYIESIELVKEIFQDMKQQRNELLEAQCVEL